MGLANIMGISASETVRRLRLKPLKLTFPLTASLPDLEQLVTTALKQRPDLKRHTHSIAKIDAALGEVKAERYPTIALTGSLSGNRANATVRPNDIGTTIGLSFSMNLFSGGRSKHQMAELESSRREVEFQRQRALLALKTNLSSALTDVKYSREQVALRQQTQTLVKQSRDKASTAYQSGGASYTQVNEAQNELVKARSRLAQARVSLLIAWEKLETLTGEYPDKRQ